MNEEVHIRIERLKDIIEKTLTIIEIFTVMPRAARKTKSKN